MTTTRITRRQGLLGLFGGGLGLKAFVTGLPAWYLLNPRRATAQDLQCAITARENLQYLILSVSSNGDPLNCNVPGTYEATGDRPPDADRRWRRCRSRWAARATAPPCPGPIRR